MKAAAHDRIVWANILDILGTGNQTIDSIIRGLGQPPATTIAMLDRMLAARVIGTDAGFFYLIEDERIKTNIPPRRRR